MKKLNLPLILGLAIGAVVAAVGIHFLHRYQISRSAETLLARAEKAAEAGDVDEQIRLLNRYLRHRRDDLAALKTLLKVLREEAFSQEKSYTEIGKVLGALEKAVRDYPDDAELRREASQTMFRVGRVTDAVAHLNALAELNALEPEDEINLARGLWLTGDQDEGMKILSEMVGFDVISGTFDETKAKNPKEVAAYNMLNQMYARDKVRNNDMTVPTAIMDRCVELNPDSADAYLNRALYMQRTEEGEAGQEKSVPDMRKAMELAPENLRVIAAAFGTAMSTRDYAWAESLLTNGFEKHPDNPGVYAMRAELAKTQGDNEAAIEWIGKGLEKSELNGELLYRRANYEIDAEKLEAAEQTIARLQDRRFDPVRLELLRARVAMARNDFVDARNRLEKLQPLAVKGSVFEDAIRQNLTIVYRRLNMFDMLQRLVGSDSEDPNAQFNQAEILARQGKYDDALAIYQRLLTENKRLTNEGRELIFRNVLNLSVQRELQKPAAQRDWSQVDKMAGALANRPGVKDYEKELLAVDLLVRKEKLDEARRRAEKGMQTYPGVLPFVLLLVDMTPDPEQAAKLLAMAEQRFQDNASLRIARAKRVVKDNVPDAAAQLATLEAGIERFTAEEQQAINQLFVSLYQRIGEPLKALTVLKRLAVDNPKNLGIQLAAFDLAYAANSLEEMDATLKSIEELSSNGKGAAEWQICEANRQLWLVKNKQRSADNVQDILDLIEKARAQRPDFGPIHFARGETLLLQGQVDAAIEAMQTALENRPGEISYLQRLAEVLTAAGRTADAAKVLAQLPNDQKRTSDVVAEIRVLLTQDPARALERAKETFSIDSTDPEVLLFLADVHQAVGQVAESVPIIQRVVEIAPSNPRGWLTLVRTQVALGQQQEAVDAIERSKATVDAAALPLLLGQCYTTVRDFAKAEEQLLLGVKANPNDTVTLRNLALVYYGSQQNDKLMSALDQLMAVSDTSPEAVSSVAWARRMKAVKTAQSGSYQDYLAGKELLEKNANAAGELEGEDLIEWLRLSANRPEASSRKLAETKLDQIRNQRDLNSIENGILAYIYYQQGRWNDAQRIMIDLLAKNPGNVNFITTYVDWLIERKDFTNAAAWVRKLNPNTLDAIRYTCILLVNDKKSSEAAKKITSMVPKQIDPGTAAGMLEELGKYDKRFYTAAKQQWKKVADTNPQAVGLYIDYLTRMPEAEGMGEAIDLVQQPFSTAVQGNNAAAVQYYLTALLRGLRAHRRTLPEDSPYYARVESMIDEARKAKPDDLTLSWQQVDFFDVRTDYAQLQTLYVEMLKRPDMNDLQRAVVRNNLAFVYAISNQGAKALETIGDAISLLGPRSDFLDTRGLAYLASGKFAEALQDLRGAVADGQGAAATYFHLALAEQKSGNLPEAVAAIQRAQEMGLTEADLSKPEVALYRKLLKDLEPQLQETSTSAGN